MSSKKLKFERNSKNKKGKAHSTIDLRDMIPSKLSSIHKVTRDALDVSIVDMEEENLRLKERIKELEATFICLHLYWPLLLLWFNLKEFFKEPLN
jgi:hypothetical protein